MKRGKSGVVKVLLFLISICLLSTGTYADDKGKELFEKNCHRCHPLQRALSKTKDEAAWTRTTMRMAKKTMWAISKDTAVKIAKYLAGRGKEKEKEEAHDEKHVDTGFKFKKVRVNQFISPNVCGDCHSEIFKQWKGSMHSNAYYDPIWRKATKLFFSQVSKPGEILEMKACIKCHTPLGFRSYSITSPAEDYDKLAELPAQGIFCNWCHAINEVKHMGDSGYEVEAAGGEDDPSTMLGPRDDASSDFHPTKYSELHTKSEFCGLCHNVSHAANKLPIEMTYEEWKNSPYNTGDPETTIHCQDCHMRQKPGVPSTGKTERPDNPGTSVDDGPERKHVWTHYFVGGNALVPKLLGSEVHSKMAVERLQNAADMEIIKNEKYNKKEVVYVKVKVINSGAGHYLPTGFTEIRQMWLDIKITDKNGNEIFRSGALDKDGNLDKNAVLYHTKLGNSKGETVLNVALADRILYDYRIPPKGYVIEKYSFFIPEDAVSPLNVEAVLRYRSASQSIAKTLFGEKAPVLPVINMVKVEEKIDF